ncbi:MAG: peptidoglycan DD-metalloendopeptidase family protein [Anaerolineales bacterium]|nr:peptidoglycan DD-metalloendopeptidase family protein [Anaerolineales bacterium]
MEQLVLEEKKTKSSKIWNVIRWIPLGTMILAAVVLLGMMLAGGMTRISGWYLLQLIPPVLGIVSLIAVVIYAIVRRRRSKPIIVTGIASLVSLLPLILWFSPFAYPASLEKMSPSATIRLPADGPIRVVWGGDSLKTNYHAISPDQRWAYDLLIEPYFSGTPNLEDYGCYGVPVVAPINGTVVSAHDGEPDEVPGVVSNNFTAPTGNHVMILMDTGTYLVIAHLKNGSVAVKTGDVIEEGQMIGECGNSGNTSEPHIHIHHQRQDPTVYELNFAEGLPLYFRDHDGPPMPVGGVRMEGETIIPLGDIVQHIGK